MHKLWLSVVFLGALNLAASPADASQDTPNTIQVTGTAAISATPDQLSFTVQIERRGSEPSKLEAQVSTIARDVVVRLQEAGIKANNIESMQLTLYPQHRYDKGERVATEYVLGRSIEVTHNDVDVYATLLSDIIEAGATNVSPARLQVSDADQDYQKALQLAMQNALAKAQGMLSIMGQKVGDVLSVSEVSQPHVVAQPRAEMMRADQAGLSHPGQAHTSARVNVTFAIAN